MTAASSGVSEPISHRRVLKIALPIVLSNATVPLLGAVDTGVIGQLGLAAPIAAVGMGAVILASFYWIFGFLRMGTSGLAAQARGAGDNAEAGAILIRGLMIALAAGLAFILLQWLLFSLAFSIAPATAEVERLARSYLQIRVWGAPATIGLYAITGWLIAMEKTRGVLVLQLWMNGLNILLDLLFVLRYGWGVQGVATATLIAEWTGVALGLLPAKFPRPILARLPADIASAQPSSVAPVALKSSPAGVAVVTCLVSCPAPPCAGPIPIHPDPKPGAGHDPVSWPLLACADHDLCVVTRPAFTSPA